MLTIIRALAWEFWQSSCWIIISLFGIACALSLLFYQAPAHFQQEYQQAVVPVMAFIELLGIGVLFYIGYYARTANRLGFPQHLYLKPLSSLWLVGIVLALSLLCVFAIHLGIAFLFRMIGRIHWPIAVPLLFLVALVTCMHAIVYALCASPFSQVVTLIFIPGMLGAWFMGYITSTPPRAPEGMPWLAVLALAGSCVSYLAVKHDRRGERLRFTRLWERLIGWLVVLWPGKNWSLQTAQMAQFWLLWRTRVWVLPCINGVGLIAAVFLCLFFPEPQEAVPDFMLGVVTMNLYVLPVMAAILVISSGNMASPSSFNIAARPVNNRSFLWAGAKAYLASIGTGWLVCAVTGMGLSVAGYEIDMLPFLKERLGADSLWGLVAYIGYLWTVLGLVGSLVWTGRAWPFLVICALAVVIPHLLVFAEFFAGDAVKQIVLAGLAWLFGLTSIFGTVLAFMATVRFLKMRTAFVVGLVLAYLLLCAVRLPHSEIDGATGFVLAAGLLMLPFAPFALAPLALHWNRHR